MNKEQIKLGMKVWYKDDEWEVVFIKNKEVNLRKFVKNKEIYSGMVKIKDLKEIDECQTSITPTAYNFEPDELVEEWSKTSLPARILKKIFNLFK